MERGELAVVESCLAALYLRGIERPWQLQRRRWPRVLSALCSAAPSLGSAAAALRSAGLAEEADALCEPGLVQAGAGCVESGQVLTAASPAYPSGWRSALGSLAPPAVWVRGQVPLGPVLGVAGSRVPCGRAVEFAGALAHGALALGFSLVSGGCHGIDRHAALAAVEAGGEGRVVEVLPCGLGHAAPLEGAAQLSVCPPSAQFSPGQAMERNALVYAYGMRAVAVQPRRGVGGTWAGALDALRRRLAVVGVAEGLGGGGEQPLMALGAVSLGEPGGSGLEEFLSRDLPAAQPSLFGAQGVREPLAWSA